MGRLDDIGGEAEQILRQLSTARQCRQQLLIAGISDCIASARDAQLRNLCRRRCVPSG
jgi:hypothetical protein